MKRHLGIMVAMTVALLAGCKQEKEAAGYSVDLPKAADSLFDMESNRGFAKVAAGDPVYIRHALMEMESADAGLLETFQSSLGEAMQKRPDLILPLVNTKPYLSADRICTPFISADLSEQEQHAMMVRSYRAIQAVKQPSLSKSRAICLQEIGDPRSWSGLPDHAQNEVSESSNESAPAFTGAP